MQEETKAVSVSLLVFLYMLQQMYLYSLGCGFALTALGITVGLWHWLSCRSLGSHRHSLLSFAEKGMHMQLFGHAIT